MNVHTGQPSEAAPFTTRCSAHSSSSSLRSSAQPASSGSPWKLEGRQSGPSCPHRTCQVTAESHRRLKTLRATAHKRNEKCHPLGETHGSIFSVSQKQNPGGRGDSEGHGGPQIFLTSSQNKNCTLRTGVWFSLTQDVNKFPLVDVNIFRN